MDRGGWLFLIHRFALSSRQY